MNIEFISKNMITQPTPPASSIQKRTIQLLILSGKITNPFFNQIEQSVMKHSTFFTQHSKQTSKPGASNTTGPPLA